MRSCDMSKGKEKKRKCITPLHVSAAAAVDVRCSLGAVHISSSENRGVVFLCPWACLSSPTRIRIFLAQGHCFIFKSCLPHLVGVKALGYFIHSKSLFPHLWNGNDIILPTSECRFEDQSRSNEYSMNEAHFHSILSHFKKFKPNGLRVVKWCGIVCNGPSSPIMSGWRKKPVTHPSLISPFPSPI